MTAKATTGTRLELEVALEAEDGGGKRSVLTFSALNTYRNCPKKYKLRYLDGL